MSGSTAPNIPTPAQAMSQFRRYAKYDDASAPITICVVPDGILRLLLSSVNSQLIWRNLGQMRRVYNGTKVDSAIAANNPKRGKS